MIHTKRFLFTLAALAFAGPALAQMPDSARFYKLDFVVKEVEGGKTVNSRSFSAMQQVQMPGGNTAPSSIRAGGRVPVSSGSNNQFQYYDLGVNIDARDLRETSADLSVNLTVDISSIAQETPSAVPVVRQNKWSGAVLVAPRKPTVVFASDDVSSKRQLQLELTATPVAK